MNLNFFFWKFFYSTYLIIDDDFSVLTNLIAMGIELSRRQFVTHHISCLYTCYRVSGKKENIKTEAKVEFSLCVRVYQFFSYFANAQQ